MEQSLGRKSANSFIWKLGQSLCNLGSTFVVQILLARLLAPEDFGIVAITTVFITVANTIVETSFSSSVVQKEGITDKEISSIFFANLVLSVIVYAVLFFLAPSVAKFYSLPILTAIIRVQSLRVLFSAFYTIQLALMRRNMEFKKIFFCYLFGAVAHIGAGVAMAYNGFGVWSITLSSLANYVVAGGLAILFSKWRPILQFSWALVKPVISYGSKVLVTRLVQQLFLNLRSLVIGKVYDSTVLGFFNKGFQFPATAMTVVDGSLTPVAFSALSRMQTEKERLLISLRNFMRMVMFVTTPLMVGMILLAEPLVSVLLTDKWLGCVPFLQAVCLSELGIPMNQKTTALESLGKSGLSLALHSIGTGVSVLLLFSTMSYPPIVMVLSGVVSAVIMQIGNAIVAKKTLDYGYWQQLKDFAEPILPTLIMAAAIIGCMLVISNPFVELIVGFAVGVAVYFLAAWLLRCETFSQYKAFAAGFLKKVKKS